MVHDAHAHRMHASFLLLSAAFLPWAAGITMAPDTRTHQRHSGFLSHDALLRGREELSLAVQFAIEIDLPTEFDARERWPNCRSISEIFDQGACGDCWAVATVMAATDRLCIARNGTSNPRLSVEHMVGCCKACGYGCADGFPNYAWSWLAGGKGEPYGLVTGGALNNTRWCSSYTIPRCNHYDTPHESSLPSCEHGPPHPTPVCPTSCDTDSRYKVPFAKDIHRFSSAFAVPSDEQSIMREIFTNGPVTAGFNVYSDWIHYPKGTPSNGVYRPQGGEDMGGHAVRIIGWGVADGEKYWLVANSFGHKWGDKGLFKILRGVGSAGIEQSVVAGLP